MSERGLPIERESVAAADADRAAALAEGLSELDLPFRATLELRYRRGLPDSTIAAVAQLEESEIIRQRSRALVWLAQRAGMEGPDAIDAVESGLTLLWEDKPATPSDPEAAPAESEPEPEVLAEPEPEPEPEPEALPEPVVEATPTSLTGQAPLTTSVPPPSRAPGEPVPPPKPFPSQGPKPVAKPSGGPSSRRLLVLVALAAVVAVLLVVINSGGSEDATTGGAGAVTPAGTTTPKGDKPASASVAMQMLPGVDIAGSIDVTMSGDPAQPELDMKLNDLPDPDGEYRAWLYSSVIDSRSLGRARKGDGEIKATLPAGWQDYPFVDVSIQDPGSIAHSGESITRISTADLPQP